MKRLKFLLLLSVIPILVLSLAGNGLAGNPGKNEPWPPDAKDIVHDAEYYILEAQYRANWGVEDLDLNARLATQRGKFGDKPPTLSTSCGTIRRWGKSASPICRKIGASKRRT